MGVCIAEIFAINLVPKMPFFHMEKVYWKLHSKHRSEEDEEEERGREREGKSIRYGR